MKNVLEKQMKLIKDNDFIMYGAGIVATSVYTAIKDTLGRVPSVFIVDKPDGNPVEIDGIRVCCLDDFDYSMLEKIWIVAIPEIHHELVKSQLLQKEICLENIFFIDSLTENAWMEFYCNKDRELLAAKSLIRNVKVASDEEIKVFQAKCHVDKTLKCDILPEKYVCPIQVGAELTDIHIAKLQDNVGENISAKNRNYCELTASYYAWRNNKAQYKGLCHYRRIFDLTEEELRDLIKQGVDVILPYPSIYYPDMDVEHTRYVKESDWSAMLQAMKEEAPEYYEAYVTTISKEPYFYNYNMLIAKREVFDDYCQFLFSVLERTEQLTTPKGWERADRFAGYLGENLTTIYFRKNRDKLNIAYTGKIWLV